MGVWRVVYQPKHYTKNLLNGMLQQEFQGDEEAGAEEPALEAESPSKVKNKVIVQPERWRVTEVVGHTCGMVMKPNPKGAPRPEQVRAQTAYSAHQLAAVVAESSR